MKLNKLLPIVALSGIATVAMPLVACSTNGGDTPEPEPVETIKIDEVVGGCLSSKEVNLTKETTYKLEVKFADMHDVGVEDKENGWGLICGILTGEDPKLIYFDALNIKAWLGEKPLDVGKDGNDIAYNDDIGIGGALLPKKALGLDESSILTFELKVDPNKDLPCQKGSFMITDSL